MSRHRYRRDPAAAAQLLARIQKSIPSPSSSTVDLVAAWQALGQIGAGAIPVSCSRNGVVTIACRDGFRAQELMSRSDQLVQQLSQAAGVDVTGLRTVIADHAVHIPDVDGPPPRPEPSAQAKAAAFGIAQGITEDIDDAQLRELMMRAVTNSLAQQWGEKRSK
jgi:hypothetical protein